ncbi:MAG: WXG100 family type VII secretion target [Anaerolineae bacterium]|jgi:WXG100 family type VII secretion target|nr:WXG100 family type VII secretion target [Anaerolineae bacterium]
MAEKIRVNYEALEEMANICMKNYENLEQVLTNIRQIANQLTSEALVGDVGQAFSDALTGPFSNSVKKLGEKFKEVSDDIHGAINDMKSADSTAGGNF